MPKVRIVVFLLFVSMLAACGGESPAAPTAPSVDVSGVWQGVVETPIFAPDGVTVLFSDTTSVTLALTQSGLNVAGGVHLFLSGDGDTDLAGTLSGTLKTASFPTTMEFGAAYSTAETDCRSSLSGTLNVTTSQLEGAFTGQNCARPFVGTLRAFRRQ